MWLVNSLISLTYLINTITEIWSDPIVEKVISHWKTCINKESMLWAGLLLVESRIFRHFSRQMVCSNMRVIRPCKSVQRSGKNSFSAMPRDEIFGTIYQDVSNYELINSLRNDSKMLLSNKQQIRYIIGSMAYIFYTKCMYLHYEIFHIVMRMSSEKYDLESITVNQRNVVFQTWFWPAILTWIFECWWMERGGAGGHLIHHTVTRMVMKSMLSPCINHITCCISYLRVGIRDTSYGNIFSRISRAWTQNIKQGIRLSRFDNIHNSSFTKIIFDIAIKMSIEKKCSLEPHTLELKSFV